MFNNAHGGANMADRIQRLPEVKDKTGLQRSTIYKQIADGTFPKPIALGSRAVGWLEREIDGWIEERIAASREVDGGKS